MDIKFKDDVTDFLLLAVPSGFMNDNVGVDSGRAREGVLLY
jgi:hypothetical protein